MPLQINELKVGVTITLDNNAFVVVSVDHVKPGKGSAFARCKLRNLKLGTIIERTFRSEEIQEAYIDQKEFQYSYKAGSAYHFLDQQTYEDLALEESQLGDSVKFLKENLIVTAYFFKNELLNISLPNTVSYKIIHTEPGFKGDTAKGSGKPATIETGAIIQVPLFVNEGEEVRVDTRTGEYLGRTQ